MDPKELFMQVHDALIVAYLDDNPSATMEQAEQATADLAYERMRDMFADLADQERQKRKDRL